jgi:hypothetical protein
MRRLHTASLLGGLLVLLGAVALLLASSPSSHASRYSGRATAGVATEPPPILTAWIINEDGHVNPHWATSPVDVQSVQQVDVGGIPYAQVRTNSIADYYTTLTAELIQEINSRPRAATDFRSGQTTATQGQTVRFGDDIGYRYQSCFLGWWPPGPGCPTAQNRTFNFPMQPLRATQVTSTTLGAIGLWVNGTAVYNWSDAQSYNNGRVWYNTALSFERLDMDLCPGHAANGDYHHHSYPDCLARQLGDAGGEHSPVYGFAADGYPIYGPWEGAGVLAESGWRTRDYDDPTSLTGCGVARVRNCLLRDPLDPTQGTVTASQVGPRTDATLTTMSGNVISATSGVYAQDYWFDRSCATCLDEHNAHDTQDGRGYHYHVTVRQPTSGTRLVPVYPYILGPTYAGQLHPAATYTPTPVASTSTSTPTASRTSTLAPSPTSVPAFTSTFTTTPSRTPISSYTPTSMPTSTSPATATSVPVQSSPTNTIIVQVTASNTPQVATATPSPCALHYTDVPSDNTFYTFIQCLGCRSIVSGYSCGGEGEPCDSDSNPYFRPNVSVTRGQIAKIVSNGAGYDEDPNPQIYEDVPPDSTFYQGINRLSRRGHMGGYPCGGEGEPCVGPYNNPYFRPTNNVTRGQLAKIVSNAAGFDGTPQGMTFSDVAPANTFYLWIERLASRGIMSGYPCGGVGESCDNENRPYFRPFNNITRGQASKIVAGAFFPACQIRAR